MQTIIYIDSIFLINVIMDFLLLSLTVKTLKITATFFRRLIGSVIGATGYCLVLCLSDAAVVGKTVCIMIPSMLLMIMMGCKTKSIKELFYAGGYYFTYAFLIGGFIIFLNHKISFLQTNKRSIFWIMIAGLVGFILCFQGIRMYRKKAENHFCKIILFGDDKPICIYGLMDTGNGLTDPISKRPVAILEEEVWKQMEKAKRPEKFKIIPYHSIGKESGILESYEVEKIEIEQEMGKKELTNVLIAVFHGKLSVKGDYQMILPWHWSM